MRQLERTSTYEATNEWLSENIYFEKPYIFAF